MLNKLNEHNDSLDQLKRAALLRLLKQRGATRVIETVADDMALSLIHI